MATLYLMVGLPCAGKTTLARQLEQQHAALRLTPDEWQLRLFGQDIGDADHDKRHDLIETMLWEVAARVLLLGVNVILDFGFWAKVEREDYRAHAKLGASSEICFCDVPNSLLLERLRRRNLALPHGVFCISEAKLQTWIDFFQRPTYDELDPRS